MTHDYKSVIDGLLRQTVTLEDDFDWSGYAIMFDGKHLKAILSALELAIALQPRPIEEAPNDVSIMIHRDDNTVEFIDAEENDYTWVAYDGINESDYGITKPTHFYDLSALPKPTE